MARLDSDRQAAVRLCLVVILLPIAVGVAAFVGVMVCGASAEVGALMLLTACACGVTLAMAAYDWLADRIAARLLARTAPAPDPEPEVHDQEVLNRLFRRHA